MCKSEIGRLFLINAKTTIMSLKYFQSTFQLVVCSYQARWPT